MKLSQYKEKKKHKKLIVIALVIIALIGGAIIDRTFANFKVNKSFKVMEGNFIYEGSGDVIFAFYKGDEQLTLMPEKTNKENLTFQKGECDKGALVEWDDDAWAPKVLNLHETKTTCKLYFDISYNAICNSAGVDSGACYLAKMVQENRTYMAYDNTKDNNLRFIGGKPNNYVKFNNETWRIIGVMNNVEDENGNMGSHLKIIRDTSIGDYSWDSSIESVNNGNGVNEWSDADIQKVLNDNYYNKKAGGSCYGGIKESYKSCPNWASIGLNDEARSMVSKVKWHTGTMSVNYDSNKKLATPFYMYEMERSENKGKICLNSRSDCNDEIERTTVWPGYVGLMYPSDFGYATGGVEGVGTSDFVTRKTCLSVSMGNWYWPGNYNSGCGYYTYYLKDSSKGNWLDSSSVDSNNYQYTITSIPDGYYAYKVFTSNLGVNIYIAANPLAIRPVVYLNSNVKIKESTSYEYGSYDTPFQLSI